MDVDDTVAGRGKSDVLEVEGGGRGGRGGDIGDGSFSSQVGRKTHTIRCYEVCILVVCHSN